MPRRPKLPKYVRRHHGRFRSVFQIAGQTKRSPICDTPEEAKAWEKDCRATNVQDGVLTLEKCFEHLIATIKSEGAAADTIGYYQRGWGVITQPGGWGPDRVVATITIAQVRRYIEKRTDAGVSLQTAWTKEVQCLQRILNQAVRDKLIGANPLAGLRRPRLRQDRFPYLPAARITALVATIRAWPQRGRGRPMQTERDADIVQILFWTGVRRSELARLDAESVDFTKSVLFVRGKTANRYVPFGEGAAAILRRSIMRAGDGPLFGTAKQISRCFDVWRVLLEEPRLSPHAMRHSYATDHVRRGVHQLDLMQLLGHVRPEQTARYYHADPARLRSAATAIEGEAGDHGAQALGP